MQKRKIILVILLLLSIFSKNVFALTYEQIKEYYHKSFDFERKQRYEEAIRVLMPIYKTYPNTYTINLRLGWLYYLRKNYKNSEYHYKKAANIIPSAIEPLLGLTLPLMAEEKWEETEKICYRILKTDFYNYYGNLRLSIALRKQKKYQLSETIARKMLALYPTDIFFLEELGLSLYGLGKKDKAFKIFKDLLILNPSDPVASRYLGSRN